MVTTRRQVPVTTALWLAAACAAIGGCVQVDGDGSGSYTMRDPFRANVSTVVVDMFHTGREVYRRELEFRLTEAVQKRIESKTHYKLTTRNRADTELRGEVVEVTQEPLSFNPDTGNPRELEITMTISFQWRDLRSGDILAENQRLVVTGTYIPDAPLSEDFFQGSQDVIEKAAIRIVEGMEAPWEEPPPETTENASAS